MVLVFDGSQAVGASTGVPLLHENQEFQQPFLDNGFALSKIFYCGESVLLKEYRGKGVGKRFFAERERHARHLGGFTLCTFCAVERPSNHPRRPGNFIPFDIFWGRLGYVKYSHLRTDYSWKDLDENAATLKPMVFWLKSL